MNRVEFFLQPIGLAAIALITLFSVLVFVRNRLTKAGSSGDPLGFEVDDSAGSGGRGSPQTVFPDFRTLLDKMVLPQRRKHPDWDRLDGAYDVRGRVIATFMRDGTAYGLYGDSSFNALEAIASWMDTFPGQDPFIVPGGQGPKGRLRARPEVGIADPKSLRIETD